MTNPEVDSLPDVQRSADAAASAPADAQPGQHVEATAGTPLPQPGEIFDGKYRIEGMLGQGGMAAVLAARHLHLDERVAVKLLLPQWTEDPEFVDRFLREGRAAIRIKSEHVVRVLDVGIVNSLPYLVMEYLEGADLEQLLARQGPLPIQVAIDYLLQTVEAIAEAHVLGIIHRDLKPANLFLTRSADGSPCVKVLDFGISKLMSARSSRLDARQTTPSLVMGSPHYMSPEQMQAARNVDARSDIWSLGAILHEFIAGTPPFDGDTVTALCATILKDAPPPLTSLKADVPPALEAAVLRCLAKDPAQRYQNVAELARGLADFGTSASRASASRAARILDMTRAEDSTQPAWPVAATERGTPSAMAILHEPRKARRTFGYVASAMALVAVGSGIGWMIVNHDRALHAAEARATTLQLSNGTVPGATTSSIPPPPPESALPTAAGSAEPNRAAATSMGATPTDAPVIAAKTSGVTESANVDETSSAKGNGATQTGAKAIPASNVNEAEAAERARAARWHAPRPHHPAASPRARSAALPDFPVPETKYVPSVGAEATAPPLPADSTPTPAPATSSPSNAIAPSSNPNELFDDRK